MMMMIMLTHAYKAFVFVFNIALSLISGTFWRESVWGESTRWLEEVATDGCANNFLSYSAGSRPKAASQAQPVCQSIEADCCETVTCWAQLLQHVNITHIGHSRHAITGCTWWVKCNTSMTYDKLMFNEYFWSTISDRSIQSMVTN